jgi:type II secretion system protein G
MHKAIKGFTLIELLVVIAIIGLLASVVLVALNQTRQKARITQRLANLAQLKKALELYYDDNKNYPYTNYPNAGNARTQCSGTGASWETPNLPPNQVVMDVSNLKTLVPSYIGSFPADPSMNAAANQNCYYYYSNGVDYKLIIWGLVDMTLAQINENPVYKDPARNDTTNTPPCTSFTDPALALSVYSPGARCW